MKGYINERITPQQKMVGVNKKFGNVNIATQQGTTRTLFDAISLTGAPTTFRFFENASTKPFPLTNLTSDGNRLQVGDTFVIEKVYFALIQYDAVNNTIVALNTVGNTPPNDFSVPLLTGELDIVIGNSQVVKSLPTCWQNSFLNMTAVNTADTAFGFATDIVIPPLLEYVLQFRTTSYDIALAAPYTHIMCVLQGSAGILAPKSTF